MSHDVLALHRPGDPAGGQPWRDALSSLAWADTVIAPDLPSHGDAPLADSTLEWTDSGFVALRVLAERERPDELLVIGVGLSGWAASIIGLAGDARAIVLVDGLGGPWVDHATRIEGFRARLRTIVASPELLAVPNGDEPDPRLGLVEQSHGNAELAEQAARHMQVPTLILESPRSGNSWSEAEAIAAAHAAPVELAALESEDPDQVAAVVADWLPSVVGSGKSM